MYFLGGAKKGEQITLPFFGPFLHQTGENVIFGKNMAHRMGSGHIYLCIYICIYWRVTMLGANLSVRFFFGGA